VSRFEVFPNTDIVRCFDKAKIVGRATLMHKSVAIPQAGRGPKNGETSTFELDDWSTISSCRVPKLRYRRNSRGFNAM
jgi:hypothetical protein